jgi:pimeloyl-ACP methyl ester carboxylesterase
MIAPFGDRAKFGAYAELPNVKLWFIDTGGAGEPVMLLHPNTGTCETWEPQITGLSQAAYRIIAYDAY